MATILVIDDERLRARIRERDPKAAVMILTGAASDKLERQAQELGVTDSSARASR